MCWDGDVDIDVIIPTEAYARIIHCSCCVSDQNDTVAMKSATKSVFVQETSSM